MTDNTETVIEFKRDDREMLVNLFSYGGDHFVVMGVPGSKLVIMPLDVFVGTIGVVDLKCEEIGIAMDEAANATKH